MEFRETIQEYFHQLAKPSAVIEKKFLLNGVSSTKYFNNTCNLPCSGYIALTALQKLNGYKHCMFEIKRQHHH